MTRRIAVAAAQYPLHFFRSWSDYRETLDEWIARGAGQAQLLVFPEYAGMELASLSGADTARDLVRSISAVSAMRSDADSLHAELARKHGVHVLAGSLPSIAADGRARNVARLFTPDGAMGEQGKLMMTRFEDEIWGVRPATEISVFDTSLARIGVAICFDVEFPLIARAMADAGAEVVLAPSCTDTQHGYWRVRIGAQARALESQFHVVQSPLIGDAEWLTACDVNVGAAGLFGPPDKGFPIDGVLALGEMNTPGWIAAAIDLDAAEAVRANGAVFNDKRWKDQPGARPLGAQIVTL